MYILIIVAISGDFNQSWIRKLYYRDIWCRPLWARNFAKALVIEPFFVVPFQMKGLSAINTEFSEAFRAGKLSKLPTCLHHPETDERCSICNANSRYQRKQQIFTSEFRQCLNLFTKKVKEVWKRPWRSERSDFSVCEEKKTQPLRCNNKSWHFLNFLMPQTHQTIPL